MMPLCNWCQKNEVEFQLNIYFLRKEKGTVANQIGKAEQLVRNGLYLQVNLCEKCLPCTSTANPIKARLTGK